MINSIAITFLTEVILIVTRISPSKMLHKKVKILKEKIIPITKKVAEDALKGYVFGSILGVFVPGSRSISENMHKTGKTFAKISATYTAAEFLLETARDEKDIYNTITAGSVAGAVSCRNHRFMGAAVFGAYAGLSEYLNDDK